MQTLIMPFRITLLHFVEWVSHYQLSPLVKKFFYFISHFPQTQRALRGFVGGSVIQFSSVSVIYAAMRSVLSCFKELRTWFSWCSGYHIRLTRGRSPVRSRAKTELIPHGLVARIAGFHPAGPGSIPGVGNNFF